MRSACAVASSKPISTATRLLLSNSAHIRHENSVGHSLLKCRITAVSVLGIEISNDLPSAVLNSTTYVPSVFGPKIMIRFLPVVASLALFDPIKKPLTLPLKRAKACL